MLENRFEVMHAELSLTTPCSVSAAANLQQSPLAPGQGPISRTGNQSFCTRKAQQATSQSLLLENAAVLQGDLDLRIFASGEQTCQHPTPFRLNQNQNEEPCFCTTSLLRVRRQRARPQLPRIFRQRQDEPVMTWAQSVQSVSVHET